MTRLEILPTRQLEHLFSYSSAIGSNNRFQLVTLSNANSRGFAFLGATAGRGLPTRGAKIRGCSTDATGQKDTAKLELRKVLQAVVYALKANYPDTFEAELRSWGFRKESY
ncbi:hypothetical protein GCM10027594_20400 [Hymenobacter agri]